VLLIAVQVYIWLRGRKGESTLVPEVHVGFHHVEHGGEPKPVPIPVEAAKVRPAE